jgi:hypothetical protein
MPDQGILNCIFHDIDLDFTGTDYDTKAECNAEGIQFSDADTPYPATCYVQQDGTWTHVTSSGWKPATTDETKGPSLIFPIARSENWELEIVFNFDSSDVSDTGQLILFAMTPSNHIAFFAMADDSHGSADQLVFSLFTNDGDDTYSSAYVGSGLAGTGQRTIKLRNLNGTYGIWDDQDDSWHDDEGRQSVGIPYGPMYLGLQARKGANTMVTFEVENLKLTYL